MRGSDGGGGDRGATPHGTVIAGRHTWHVYFRGVARVGRDWFVECSVVGPRRATVTVRCPAAASHAEAAQRIVGAVRIWLTSGDRRDEAYLELSDALAPAS